MKKILFLLLFPLLSFGQQDYILTDENGVILQDGNDVLGFTESATFKPTDIAGNVLWLDAGQGVTKDGSDYVSQWNDLSGNGNNAIQGTGSAQPLYVANQLNGEPVIRFDGINDMIDGTDIGNYNTGQGSSLFIVCVGHNVGVGSNVLQHIFTANYLSDTYTYFSRYIYPTIREDLVLSSVGVYTTAGTLPNSGFTKVIEIISVNSGNPVNVYFNGNLDYSNNISNTCFVYGIYHLGYASPIVGFSSYFDGDIAEVIFYNSALDDTNRGKVETYLNQKYLIY